METIKEDILSSFNYEDIRKNKTIDNFLNEKTTDYTLKKDLYSLYEREAEHLVRTSFLIKHKENSYVLCRDDENEYYLEKAGIIDRIMNFLNTF